MEQQKYSLLFIFAAALLLRLLYLCEISDNPFFTSPVVDAYTYTQQAEVIAAGHWLDFADGPFWQPPLYPWFLGAIYSLAGEHFYSAARLIQASGGAISCILLYLIGRRLFSTKVGLLAASALAVYGPAIYFDSELLPASLAVLLLLLLLLAVLAVKPQASWRWGVPGLLLGVGAINVPTILSLAPCLLLWIYIRGREQRRSKAAALRAMGMFGAGLLLAIAPVTLRNYVIGHDGVLISWNAGVNFYLGNNADYSRTIQIRPGQAWLELMARAQSAGVRNGSENSRFFFGEAWKFIREQPGDYLRLLAAKSAAFWNGGEVGRNQNIYYLRNYSHLLSLVLWKHTLAFPFGLVAPLAIAGFFLAIPRRGPTWLLLGSILSYAGGVILFFVTARYRLPLTPLLLLSASSAVFWLAENLRRRRAVALAWTGAILLLAAWINSGTGRMDMAGDAELYYNLGHAYIEKKRFGEGIRALEQAASMAPDDADILFSLGTAYALIGDYRKAVQILEPARQLYPGRLDLRLNLGNAYFYLQLYTQALAEYQVVLEAHPDDLEPLRSAARAAARAGQAETAITYYERLHRLEPEAVESCLALGYFYRATGQPEKALDQYEEALKLDPGHLTALLETGLLYLEKNALDRALETFRQAARRHPQAPQVYVHLGEVHERQGHWQEAVEAYRQVVRLDPNYPDIHRRLARLYQGLGNTMH